MVLFVFEMVCDIEEDMVDFIDNYDGQMQELMVFLVCFLNLFVNGLVGIVVGMVMNIFLYNFCEVFDVVFWVFDNLEIFCEELFDGLIQCIFGLDFLMGVQILGIKGIYEVYWMGCGLIMMCVVVNVEEIQGWICLVIMELLYQVNLDNVVVKIGDFVCDGKIIGIVDICDELFDCMGQCLVVVFKCDVVVKVVLNNLYKYMQLQENFGVNMFVIVDGVLCMFVIDGFILYWIVYQIDVIVWCMQFCLVEVEKWMYILCGYLKVFDVFDEVIVLIWCLQIIVDVNEGLQKFFDIDEIQVDVILQMQLC